MDLRIVTSTLQGKCVCCGKRAPDCPDWEQCYERRLMGSRGFRVCALCGDGFGEREKQQHAGACLARYLQRVEELRESQVADRLIPPIGLGAVPKNAAGGRSALPLPSAAEGMTDGLGDLPPALAWMYPGSGVQKPAFQRSMTFATTRPRPRPVRVTVKDKGIQAEVKTRDKSTQTSAIELQPGEDLHFVRWTGVAQTKRPLLETDRARIYTLMENLRRAVADVLGGEELDATVSASEDAAALPAAGMDTAFASAERQLGEIEEILRARTVALERALRPTSSPANASDSEDTDGSVSVTEGSPRETQSVASGESDEPEESEATISFASALASGSSDSGKSDPESASGSSDDEDETDAGSGIFDEED